MRSVMMAVLAIGCADSSDLQAEESEADFELRTSGVEYCDGLDNDFNGSVDEGCAPCSFEATRNSRFWVSATCVLEGSAPGVGDLLPVTVGASLSLDDAAEADAFLSTAPSTPKERLGLQIATARLNAAAFGVGGALYHDVTGDGVDDSLDTILGYADAAYDGGSSMSHRRFGLMLRRINASGAALDTWFDPSCATDPEICNGADDDGDGTVDEVCACTEVCDGYDNDFDGIEDNDCPAVECPTEPVDGCVSLSQAVSKGDLSFSNSSNGVTVYVQNTGADPVCLDDYLMVTSPGTQAFMWGSDVGGGLELDPGESVSLYYGSWTTDNGYYEAYFGQHAWWCIEAAQYVAGGATFEVMGEVPPPALLDIVNGANDYDGDGKEDHVDWQGVYGVATNYAIWDYQAASTALTVGKSAWMDGTTATVAVTVRNAGAIGGDGVAVDIVPAGWTVLSAGGATVTPLGDGSTELSWDVSVEGYEDGGLTWNKVEMSYEISMPGDSPMVDLGAAEVSYFDGLDDRTSTSLSAYLWRYDGNADGVVECD